MKTAIVSSTADPGTRSILAAYEAALKPDSVMKVPKGLKKLKLFEILGVFRFILKNWLQGNTVLYLHNAPILLCGLFPLPRRGRWVGIIDWNEMVCRSGQKIPFFALYDLFYRMAFRRMSAVYSPSRGFIDLYNTFGIKIDLCEYPPPAEPDTSPRPTVQNPVRVLFVGADYTRKGGNLLLDAWKDSAPSGASLTFVCPHPPDEQIKGVSFLRNIKAGTREQKNLFHDHDIFILPTKNDAFGFALLEALNAGMCVVTTVGAGAAGVVERFGGFVAIGPEQAIAHLLELVQNPAEVDARRKYCQAYIPEYRSQVKSSLLQILGRGSKIIPSVSGGNPRTSS